jgi:hypothetical protein
MKTIEEVKAEKALKNSLKKIPPYEYKKDEKKRKEVQTQIYLGNHSSKIMTALKSHQDRLKD